MTDRQTHGEKYPWTDRRAHLSVGLSVCYKILSALQLDTVIKDILMKDHTS